MNLMGCKTTFWCGSGESLACAAGNGVVADAPR